MKLPLPHTPTGWAMATGATIGASALLYALWPVPARVRVARAALSQLGRSDAAPYWSNVLPTVAPSGWPKDWCGAFALWALHQADLALDWEWIIGQGFLFRLPTTNDPQVGDIAYFTTNEHQAVIVGVDGDTLSLVNGNGARGAVSASTVDRSRPAAVYSIAPLIQAEGSDSGIPWLLASVVVSGAAAWVLLPSK